MTAVFPGCSTQGLWPFGHTTRGVEISGRLTALSPPTAPATRHQERERNRIVAAGGFVTDMHGQHRVNGNLNLSRAIGDLKYKGVKELHPKDQIITAEPDIMVQVRVARVQNQSSQTARVPRLIHP